MVDADMPMHTPPSPEVCGLQIRCAWLEVRLGVEEMQGGTAGEQKQFGATEEKDISQRGLVVPQKLREQKVGGPSPSGSHAAENSVL